MFGRVCFAFGLALCYLSLSCDTCPAQCSCFYHKLSDGSKSSSIVCNDPDINVVPNDFPSDASKLRIEKTAIRSIIAESFHYLHRLEYLWISFNSLSSLSVDSFRGLYALDELRMDGNLLTSFPWECLMDMPSLRLLDLHNNKINSIPVEATLYMKNVTYLDLSGNSLATVPAELLSSFYSPRPQNIENSKMILGLHDNPWQCDCRLFDLFQLQKFPSTCVAFIDTRLHCVQPDSLSGLLVSNADLRKCQAPRVHTAVARARGSIGNDVVLRCGTVGVPGPEISWSRADGRPMNGTVQQETSAEGIIWSILSLPAVAYRDSGKYVCKATNFVGSANAVITLVISDTWQIAEIPRKTSGKKSSRFGHAAYQEKLIARYVPPAAVPMIEPVNGLKATASLQVESYSVSERASGAAAPRGNSTAEMQRDASSLQRGPERRIVRSVKVIGDTDHTVSLNWRAPTATNITAFSVLYAVFGERDMRRINVEPGKNRVTIEGLVPKTKYIACVCVKGLVPKKEQCVIFSTDEAASASGTQKLINVVVITVACVIAVPLTLIVCCGALKRRLQKLLGSKSKDVQDSYVTFETLSPGTKAKGLEGEYLSRLGQDESNRLLSARSSVESEATRTEGQPNEYFC